MQDNLKILEQYWIGNKCKKKNVTSFFRFLDRVKNFDENAERVICEKVELFKNGEHVFPLLGAYKILFSECFEACKVIALRDKMKNERDKDKDNFDNT